MSEKEKEKKSIFEKAKNVGVKKISRVVVSIFFVFALVFATITNLTFSTFNFSQWLANTFILIGIIIFGMVIGESGAIDNYRTKQDGIYQRNVREYNTFIDLLKPMINNFDMWYSEQLPREFETKQINFLVKNGFKVKTARNIIKYCKENDIKDLTSNEVTKKHDNELDKDIYIEKVEEHQIEALKWVLGGKIKLNSPNPNYFTTLYNDDLNDDALSEQGTTLIKTRRRIKNINRGMRIGSSVVISVVMAALTVQDMMKGEDLQAWMNLITRITAFLTSILSGHLSGKTLVNYDARIVKNKYEVLLRYHNDIINKTFTIKDEQELLKNKYEKEEERKKKEEEEAKSRVIDPSKDKDKVEIIGTFNGKPIEVMKLENKSNQIE